MSIFDKNPIDNLNAILNWRMDNGSGYIDQFKDRQLASDFNQIGRAFLANSLISLCGIIENKNTSNEADTLIFPILFNVWHSFELLLKSGILTLDILKNPSSMGTNNTTSEHKINSLIIVFKNQLTVMGLVGSVQKYLQSIEGIINDFDTKNARFDFGRYSYGLDLRPQFYNQPDANNRIIDNTYINIRELIEVLTSILDDFVELIDELNNQIEDIDKGSSITVTDKVIDDNINHKKTIFKDLEQNFPTDDSDYYEYLRRRLL
jgi:hypothetical protein